MFIKKIGRFSYEMQYSDLFVGSCWISLAAKYITCSSCCSRCPVKITFCVVYFTSRCPCCPILHNLSIGDTLTTVHESTSSLLLEHLQ